MTVLPKNPDLGADPRGSWHPCFAWLPVRLLTGQWVWLQPYDARRVVTPGARPYWLRRP